MSQSLIFFLFAHIFLGTIATAFFYNITMNLLKKDLNFLSLKRNSFLGLFSFILSWVLGGYYYVVYYGAAVKPVIKEGAYPWMHSFIMELKEHIFLFLPFLAFIVFIFLFLAQDRLKESETLKKALAFIALLVFVLGLLIAFMGILISGAVNK